MIYTFQNILNELTFVDLILLATFNVLFMLRMIYLFFFSGKILFTGSEAKRNKTSNPLSLIFTIRNEENNLKNNLPKLLEIDNIDFEVIAVDDFSQDDSFLVMGMLKKKYKRLKISILSQETRYSTKLSQNIALKAAEKDWIIVLPASVPDFSEKWLSTFSESTIDGKNVVIGYSGITETEGFYNRLLRIENFFLQFKSAGFILNNLAFVYSEENIAFRKNEYFEKGGFGQHISNPYANLELVINSFITKASTLVLFDKENSIRKTGLETKGDYLELFKKSIRIEESLSKRIKTILVLDEVTKLLFVPFAIVSFLFMMELWPLFLAIHGLKILVYLLIIKTIQIRLNERKIYVSSLVYELIMPYFRIIYKWHFNWRSKKRWRGKV